MQALPERQRANPLPAGDPCRDAAPVRMPLYTRSFSKVRSLEPGPTDDAIAAPGILIRLSGSQYEKCRLH